MRLIRRPFRYSYNGVVFWLIGINVLIFAVMYLLTERTFVKEIAGSRYKVEVLQYYLSMIPSKVLQGWVWTFITYMFVHGGITHLLFNMFALFIFGTHVERQMGSREFLFFYLVTGALAGIFSFAVYLMTGQSSVLLMGASGAIFAIELAFAAFFPRSVIYIWGILPVRAPVMVLGFTAIELLSSIFARNSGVAHLTHLAGFGFAWLYFLVRYRINPWKEFRS